MGIRNHPAPPFRNVPPDIESENDDTEPPEHEALDAKHAWLMFGLYMFSVGRWGIGAMAVGMVFYLVAFR